MQVTQKPDWEVEEKLMNQLRGKEEVEKHKTVQKKRREMHLDSGNDVKNLKTYEQFSTKKKKLSMHQVETKMSYVN